jgi:hypothetical protein
MPKFADELPVWANQFQTPTASATPGEILRLQLEIGRLGDHYLAERYNGLAMAERLSILADLLEREIIERYLQHNLALAFS